MDEKKEEEGKHYVCVCKEVVFACLLSLDGVNLLKWMNKDASLEVLTTCK